MQNFYVPYQHVELLGRTEVEGILDGVVSVQTKIDGSNGVLWLQDGELHAGSRKRELRLDDDNHKFFANIVKEDKYLKYLKDHPTHFLYGEWLIPHSIKGYNSNAWRKFYVFDVFEADGEIYDKGSGKRHGRYIPYKEYSKELDKYGIEYIPEIAELDHPTVEEVAECIKKSHFLMPEGGVPEGVVIKNYSYRNKYGRTTWAKIISEDFYSTKKDNHPKPDIDNGFEVSIASEYITDSLIRKEYAKIINDYPNAKREELIGRTLNGVFDAFLDDSLVYLVKKNKKCTINFAWLKKESDNRIKEVLKEELFS